MASQTIQRAKYGHTNPHYSLTAIGVGFYNLRIASIIVAESNK